MTRPAGLSDHKVMETKIDLAALNALNLRDCYAALNLAEMNMNAVKPEARYLLRARAFALRERIRRLEWTAKHQKAN